MTEEQKHNHIKEIAEDYVSKCWTTFLDLDEVDLVSAGIGVGKIIAKEYEDENAKLKKQNERVVEWHYVKDELPKIKVGNKVDVEVCFLNAFDNPCKKSCYWNGKDFLYWSDKKPIGEKKVSLFGKIYAWKYADNFFPEPPKEK